MSHSKEDVSAQQQVKAGRGSKHNTPEVSRAGIKVYFSRKLYNSLLNTGFPLGLENLEKWEGIFQSGKSQGILNRLEKSGKITQNTGNSTV